MLFLSVTFVHYKVYEWIIFLGFIIPQALIDYKRKVVYILPNIILAVSFQILMVSEGIYERFIAIIPGLIVVFLSLLFKESIGLGDGIIFLAVGCLIGFNQTVRIMMISFLVSGLFSIVYLLIKKGTRKDKLPFVPFILVGILLNGII